MAKTIDPSKLLPAVKSTAIVKSDTTKSVNIISKTSPLYKGLLAPKKSSAIVKSEGATEANNKLVKVDKFLKSDLIVSQKKAEVKRKNKEKEDFAEAEKKLELPKFKGIKLPTISAPSLGFMDRVKRFIFFTALGWALPKIIEFLPKLEGIARIIGGVYKFAEGLFGGLFNGFMSLVKFGGDLKDKTIGFIAQATGGDAKDFEKKFSELEKQFNNFANLSIVAGLVGLDMGLAGLDEYNKQRKKTQKPEPTKPGAKPGAKAGAKVTTGRGGEKPKGKPRVTGDVKSKPSWLDKLKGPFAKLKGPLSRFAGVAVPGLGAAVGAADAALRFKAGDRIGGTLASVSAALDAATAATALTGIGLPVAGVLGGISIGIDVVLLIRDILSVIPFVPKNLLGFYRGGRVVRKYQGGGTARGGRPVGAPKKRGITPTRRKPIKIKTTKSKPGKDVGGEKKIKEFYSKKMEPSDPDYYKALPLSTILANLGGGVQKLNEKPYKALTTTAKILKEIPLVGGIMGAAVDIALGQKPDVRIYQSLSSGIGYLVESLANQRVNMSVTSLMRDIKGFAEGGNVPASRELKGNYESINSGDLISKVLGPTIDQRVNEAIQSIEKEVQKMQQKKEGGSGLGPTPSSGGAGGAGGYAEGEENFVSSKEIYDYLKSKGVSHNHAMGMLANIQAESSFNAGAIGDNGTSGGLFQHHAERFSGMVAFAGKDWPKNWKRQIDYALREDAGKQYIEKQFNSPEEASAWFTLNFERPANKEIKSRERLENLKNFGPDGSWKGSQSITKPPTSKLDFKKLGMQVGERAGYSQSRGRIHAGRDIAIQEGTPLRTVSDAEIVAKGYEPDGYGYYVIYRDKNGKEHMYGHLKSESRFNKGDKVLANTIIGEVGSTGRSTGPHLHWEVSNKPGEVGYSRKNVIDPLESGYSATDPFGGEINPKPKPKTNAGSDKLTTQQVENLQQKVQSLKPGDKPIVISGVGSIQMGKDFFGRPKKKYFNRDGVEITQNQFNELMIKYKLPSKDAKSMQGGGIVPSKPNRPIPNSFASYETPASGMMIAIQPMIIEKQVPISGGNKMIVFPVPVAVNSNMDNLSFSRG